jgi:hypothetical protein
MALEPSRRQSQENVEREVDSVRLAVYKSMCVCFFLLLCHFLSDLFMGEMAGIYGDTEVVGDSNLF